MKLRVHGTPAEIDDALTVLRTVLDVREVSRLYPDRAGPRLARVYLDAEPAVTAQPVAAECGTAGSGSDCGQAERLAAAIESYATDTETEWDALDDSDRPSWFCRSWYLDALDDAAELIRRTAADTSNGTGAGS